MKKKILFVLVFLFSIVALVACGETVKGEQGAKGDQGAAGKSAYDLAVENGFTGSLEDWVASLEGDRGPQGDQGVPGVDGVAGKNAHEIRFIDDDGALYWTYIPNEGETIEYEPVFLYYTKDYITVKYFDVNGTQIGEDVRVARKDESSYELEEIEDHSPLLGGDGWALDFWGVVDGDDYEEYEKLTDHSVDLHAVPKYIGVNATFKLGESGGYFLNLKAYGAALAEEFVADLNAILGDGTITDGASFFTKFNQTDNAVTQFFGVKGVSGDPFPPEGGYEKLGFCAIEDEAHQTFYAKWSWLIEYVCQTFPDGYVNAALEAFGFTTNGKAPSETPRKYANRYVCICIASFIDQSDETASVHFDEYKSNQPNFAAASSYAGLAEANPTKFAEYDIPANQFVEFVGSNLDLVVFGNQPTGWYLEGDTTKTPVPVQEMHIGATYCAIYGE